MYQIGLIETFFFSPAFIGKIDRLLTILVNETATNFIFWDSLGINGRKSTATDAFYWKAISCV